MKCPYCDNEMKAGKIYAASNIVPYWLENGDKRGIGGMIDGKGALPFKNTMMKVTIESNYCPVCGKIIIDANLRL